MKKTSRTLIAALILAVAAIAACSRRPAPPQAAVAIDSRNFPDPAFRQFLLAQPYGTDSLLSDAEIAATTSLDLSGLGIADLTGIQHFVALKDLACVGNHIAKLSVAGMPALNYLNCSDNHLTDIHLADLPMLNYLDCGRNQIAKLDLSQCPALHVLACPENRLTALDLSHCTHLTTLICNHNPFSAKAFDSLIVSLPRNTTDIHNTLYIVGDAADDQPCQFNDAHASAARAKGWTPYYYYNGDWQKFDYDTPDTPDF